MQYNPATEAYEHVIIHDGEQFCDVPDIDDHSLMTTIGAPMNPDYANSSLSTALTTTMRCAKLRIRVNEPDYSDLPVNQHEWDTIRAI
jgi:hypothetical protein